jgi:hypothetical protein
MALHDAVVPRTDVNTGAASDPTGGPGISSPRDKPNVVALTTMFASALVVFCVLEFVLFQTSASNQGLLWTTLLRVVPSAGGALTLIGPAVWARGRDLRGNLRAGLAALVLFDAISLVIVFVYAWGQAVA